MRALPEPVEETVPVDSPPRYLRWLARRQWTSIVAGTLYDTVWLVGLAVTPWLVGQAIDQGVIAKDVPRLLLWTGLLLVALLSHATIQGVRDRGGIINWVRATFRTISHLSRRVTTAAPAVARAVGAGEVTATAAGDAGGIAHVYYLIGALVSATVAYALVGIILLSASVTLGLLVLVGVPVFAALSFLVVRPLRARQSVQRAASGRMTSLASDTVIGLRVLRGIGGEASFAARYRALSGETREAGNRIAWPLAAIQAIEYGGAGILVIALTWLGALAVVDHRLEPGQLVAFYGYAGFLVMPIQLISEAISTFTRAQVGADRVLGVLRVEPSAVDRPGAETPPGRGDLLDAASGLRVPGGAFVAVVADPATTREIADRLVRLDDGAAGEVQWDGRPLRGMRLEDLRSRIVLNDSQAFFFAGPVRRGLDPRGARGDAALRGAITAAAADDAISTLGNDLDSVLTTRARNLSGGQRQRLGLARALLTDAEVLVLIDPTGAVDATTESVIAERLPAYRRGRTTVVLTASPLLLAAADEVHVVRAGRVVVSGHHADLLVDDAGYREIVRREEGVA